MRGNDMTDVAPRPWQAQQVLKNVAIASELWRLYEAGKSGDEAVSELRRRFPTATTADLERACLVMCEPDRSQLKLAE
jgi:hypothetical protein